MLPPPQNTPLSIHWDSLWVSCQVGAGGMILRMWVGRETRSLTILSQTRSSAWEAGGRWRRPECTLPGRYGSTLQIIPLIQSQHRQEAHHSVEGNYARADRTLARWDYRRVRRCRRVSMSHPRTRLRVIHVLFMWRSFSYRVRLLNRGVPGIICKDGVVGCSKYMLLDQSSLCGIPCASVKN